MTGSADATAPLQAPPLKRRLACFVYEGVLLFGVVMAAGLAYGVVTQQRHALVGLHGLQAVVLIVLACYFVGFWSSSGQTLAMQTWHIRLVRRGGGAVSRGRALCRYLLSWVWFMPALGVVWIAGIKGSAATFSALGAGVLAYAAASSLRSDRQYLHDALCGTRLIAWHPGPAI